MKTKRLCPKCITIQTTTGMKRFYVKSIKLRRVYIKLNDKIAKNKYKTRLYAIGWYCLKCGYFENDGKNKDIEIKEEIKIFNKKTMLESLEWLPKEAKALYDKIMLKQKEVENCGPDEEESDNV